jgi:DNA (cytosine-5)-methyltransferase 1
MKPLLLDLFCGAGGCAMGYHRAGFRGVGVDHSRQPHYPFPFVQTDAIAFAQELFWGTAVKGYRPQEVALIHASPPCQAYSRMSRAAASNAPKLIPAVRRLLAATCKPYVIENVEGAPLEWPYVLLCGTMFGLRVRRHRIFEVRPATLFLTPACACRNGVAKGRLIGHRVAGRYAAGRTKPPRHTEAERREAIGVPWMSAREARQAIPPAYTEFLGRRLLGLMEGG